jgi:hypothetical protein
MCIAYYQATKEKLTFKHSSITRLLSQVGLPLSVVSRISTVECQSVGKPAEATGTGQNLRHFNRLKITKLYLIETLD